MSDILVTNTNIESIDLNIGSIVMLIENNDLHTINGIGDFDVLMHLYISNNLSLSSITGSTLSDNFTEFGWTMEAAGFSNNLMLLSFRGFPNYIFN